jgi:hypothetical protein
VGDAFRQAEQAGMGVVFPSMMQPKEVGEWRPMAAARHAALIAAMPERLDPALVAMLQPVRLGSEGDL